MAKVDLGTVCPYTLYTTWTEIKSTLTPQTITMDLLATNMVNNSIAILALWSPNATALQLPSGIGSYISLTVIKKTIDNVSFILTDLEKNTVYTASRWGGAYNSWKAV